MFSFDFGRWAMVVAVAWMMVVALVGLTKAEEANAFDTCGLVMVSAFDVVEPSESALFYVAEELSLAEKGQDQPANFDVVDEPVVDAQCENGSCEVQHTSLPGRPLATTAGAAKFVGSKAVGAVRKAGRAGRRVLQAGRRAGGGILRFGGRLVCRRGGC